MKALTALLTTTTLLLLSTVRAHPTPTSPPHAKRTVAPGHEYCQSFQHNSFTGLKFGLELGAPFHDGEKCTLVGPGDHPRELDLSRAVRQPGETYVEFDLAGREGWIPGRVNEVVRAIYGGVIEGGIACVDPYGEGSGGRGGGGRHAG
ncbi:hypothetical protein Tdes44962_MAKER00327 [Teratosphaeria destructans]|uniref:Uncharacterized protein n=1 Tax=Teratosphaeria destructans TaxID=418781 RepID=A0A9W7W2E8_9PEZI|nr:hypothetical protein Tdes44962_MAKER00327 [Teratosphaeria destructans]